MSPKKTLRRKKPASEVVTANPVKKKKNTRIRTAKQYFAQTEAEQETWNRSIHVAAKMRSEKISLAKASREFGLNPKVVLARVGSALRKTKSGRYVARPSDKLLRILVIPSSQGLQEIAVRGSDVASKIAEYSDAVQTYLRTGNSSKLKKFRRLKLLDEKGKRIKLVTDTHEAAGTGVRRSAFI